MRCLYDDQRQCPLCTARNRRFRVGGVRTTASPRPAEVPCWDCRAPVRQQRLGAPRLFCPECRTRRDLISNRLSRQRGRADQ